jgi:hypothetical protein
MLRRRSIDRRWDAKYFRKNRGKKLPKYADGSENLIRPHCSLSSAIIEEKSDVYAKPD